MGGSIKRRSVQQKSESSARDRAEGTGNSVASVELTEPLMLPINLNSGPVDHGRAAFITRGPAAN